MTEWWWTRWSNPFVILFETVEVVCIEVNDDCEGEVDPGDEEHDDDEDEEDDDDDDDADDVKELAKMTGGGDGWPEVSPPTRPIFPPLPLRLDKIDEIDDERLRGDIDDEREKWG